MTKPTPTPVTPAPTKATNRRIENMRVDLLKMDPRVQRRAINYKWAEWLANNWRDVSCGVFTASERANGDFIVLDGMHRKVALVDYIGLPDWEVQVEVLTGLSLKEEAQEFLDRNRNRKGVAPFDLYAIDLVAETPDAVILDRCVTTAGFVIERQAALPNKIGAINTIRSIIKKAAPGTAPDEALIRALNIVKTCVTTSPWAGDPAALGADVIGGLTLLAIDNPSMDDERMIKALTSVTLRTLLNSTKAAMQGSGGEITRARAFANIAASQYNRGLIQRKRIVAPVLKTAGYRVP